MFAKIYKGFVFEIFSKWGIFVVLGKCGCLYVVDYSMKLVVHNLKSTLFIEE